MRAVAQILITVVITSIVFSMIGEFVSVILFRGTSRYRIEFGM